jgi:AAA+ ATPase superfamily predicted ATPase
MLRMIRKLNSIRKNPRICFLFAIGSPSSYFRDEREEEPGDEPEEPEDFSRLR